MKYKAIYEQLLKRQAELKKRLQQKERENTSEATGELSLYDNHPADVGTELFERGKDLALVEKLERELDDVTTAIRKIENGTYGICEVTGKPIPLERLLANPTAKTIVEYASEQRRDRPVEEDVLTFAPKDEGEDAYLKVAEFNENETIDRESSLKNALRDIEQPESLLEIDPFE